LNRLIFSVLFALLVGVFSLDVSAENEDT